jgi:endonuclease/exonuclease/phosphatase family metal-dependent hydrolase
MEADLGKMEKNLKEEEPAFSYALEPKIFNPTTGKWTTMQKNQIDNIFHGSNLSVATYNRWFNPYMEKDRTDILTRILRLNEFDFICLQEVTSFLLTELMNQQWVRDNYILSNADPDNFVPPKYGNIMLVKRRWSQAFVEFRKHLLPSRMERTLLVARFKTPDGYMDFATTHLESLNNPHIRAEQLEECFKVLGTNQAVLCGDFNFSDDHIKHALENDELMKHTEWIDLDPKGVPTGTPMREEDKAPTEQVIGRTDRFMFYKCSGYGLRHLGKEPFIPGVYISDHIGLCCYVTV